MMTFYTYMYLRQNDATPYYVGKGSNGRAFTTHKGQHIFLPKRPDGAIDHARILIQYWHDEVTAFEMEKFYIMLFGRKENGTGILYNHMDGGAEPPSRTGCVPWNKDKQGTFQHTEEWKQEASKRMSGERHPMWKGGVSTITVGRDNWKTRKKHPPNCAHCEAVRQKKGPYSPEHCKNISNALMNSKRTEESKARQSATKKGQPRSEARRAAQEARVSL